jgi:Cu(I)/Ag(I) efflux system membrane protein CusA/SilA
MVKQYQVVLDPTKMAAFGITQRSIIEAIQKANQETGGSVLEMAETEYMVRASGYLKTLEDFRQIPLRTNGLGVPITLGDCNDSTRT